MLNNKKKTEKVKNSCQYLQKKKKQKLIIKLLVQQAVKRKTPYLRKLLIKYILTPIIYFFLFL